MRRSAFILPALCALSLSCGSITSPDDDDDDVVTVDAAAGASDASASATDGAPAVPDATPVPDAPPLRTPCGKMSCNRATQICVIRSGIGPALQPRCEPVPDGCAADRSCDCVGTVLCTDLTNECHDKDADNTILCDCPFCG